MSSGRVSISSSTGGGISPSGAGISPSGGGISPSGAASGGGISPSGAGISPSGAGISPSGAGISPSGVGVVDLGVFSTNFFFNSGCSPNNLISDKWLLTRFISTADKLSFLIASEYDLKYFLCCIGSE